MAYFDSGAGALGFFDDLSMDDLPSEDDIPSLEEAGEMVGEEAESRAREYGEERLAEAEAEARSRIPGGGQPSSPPGGRAREPEEIVILPRTEAERRARTAQQSAGVSRRGQLARQRGAALMASIVTPSGFKITRPGAVFTVSSYRAGKAVQPAVKARIAQAREEASKKRGMSKAMKAGALVGVAALAYIVLK